MQESTAEHLMSWIRRHRPTLDALGYAAVSVLLAAFGVSGVLNLFSMLTGDVSQWWALALALPACVLVAFKHRLPRVALVTAAVFFIADIVTFGGIGTLLVLLDVLWAATFGASADARRRILTWLTIAVAVLVAVAFSVSGDVKQAVLVGLQMGALLGTDYWWATAVAQANELSDLHRRQAQDAAALAAIERSEALQHERESMARELHDLVAGHVSAMAIRSEAALSTKPDAASDRAALRAVRDSSIEAHAALRSMITVLKAGGGELVVPPGLDRVPGYVDEARRAGLVVSVDGDIPESVPPPMQHAAVRVLQEALANCMRHAAGGRVAVTFAVADDEVTVRVDSRDGHALEQPQLRGNGVGLAMLRERVGALGGRFDAGPVGAGWSVRAALPVRESAATHEREATTGEMT